jgi:hypothetical protein
MSTQPAARPRPGQPAVTARRETSRERSSRIPHDYLRQQTPVGRWRWTFVVLAVIVAAGWLGITLAVPGAIERQSTHGELASVHATWDNRCEACHRPFTAINGNNWSAGFLTRAAAAAEAGNCTSCHAGPAHHASMVPGDEAACGACHRDHRGRDADIKSGVDSDCTRCHADLPAHTVGGKPRFQKGDADKYIPVTSFVGDHPPFKVARGPKDRALKFSHKLHMSPGILPPDASGQTWTIARVRAISPEMAERYKADQPEDQRQENSPVALNCASCHRADTGLGDPSAALTAKGIGNVPRESVLPARQAGVHMLPITFENHCAGCHPLTFDGSERLAKQTVPHRLKSPDLGRILTDVYSAEAVNDPEQKLFVRPDRPLPRLDKQDQEDAQARQKAAEAVGKKVGTALARLETATCAKCHDVTPVRKDDKSAGWEASVPPEGAPLGGRVIPTIWFEHAFFDHASHKAVSCSHCHGNCWPDDKRITEEALRADEKAPAHLPTIDNCKQCHAPAVMTTAGPRGGAQFGCSECHTYHNGDKTLQWRGSSHWKPAGTPERAGNSEEALRRFLEGQIAK